MEWYFLKKKPFEGHSLNLFFKCEGFLTKWNKKKKVRVENHNSYLKTEAHSPPTKRYKLSIIVKIVQLGVDM